MQEEIKKLREELAMGKSIQEKINEANCQQFKELGKIIEDLGKKNDELQQKIDQLLMQITSSAVQN